MKKTHFWFTVVLIIMLMSSFRSVIYAQITFQFELELLQVEWVNMPLDGDECCGPVPWLPDPVLTLDVSPIMYSNGSYVPIPGLNTTRLCSFVGIDQPTSGTYVPTSNNFAGATYIGGGPDVGPGFDLCTWGENFALNIVSRTFESDLIHDCEFSTGRPGDQDDDNSCQTSAFMPFINLADQPGQWKTTVFGTLCGGYGGRFTFRFRYSFDALKEVVTYKNTAGLPQSTFCEGDIYRIEAEYKDPQITGGYHLWEEWNGSLWIPLSGQHNNYIDVPIANPIKQYRVKQADNPGQTCIYDLQDWIYSSAIPSPTIVPAPPPTANINTTLNRVCPGDPLSITLTGISGYNGTTPFRITLTNSAGNTVDNIATYTNNLGSVSFNNLAEDTYTIKVSSIANNVAGETIANCTTVKALGSLTHYPNPVLSSPTVTQPQCPRDPGQISVSVTNGNAPLTFRLYDNNNNVLGLPTNLNPAIFNVDTPFAASYYVQVSNTFGCIANSTPPVVLTAPQPISADISVSLPIKCKGETGRILFNNITGGTSPYDISWRGLGSNDAWTTVATDVSAVPAPVLDFMDGAYEFQLVDANGCIQEVGSATLTEPAVALAISALSTKASACGNDGTISAGTAGGEGPFTFSIPGYTPDPGATNTATFSGLPGDLTYVVSVTDNLGCMKSVPIFVGKDGDLSLTILEQVDVTCSGDGDGSLEVTAAGGSGGYTYSKNGTVFQASPLFENLDGGPITITLEDASGCQTTLIVTIGEPETFNLSGHDIVQPIPCPGGMATTIIDFTGRRDLGDNPLMVSTDGGTNFSAINLSLELEPVVRAYIELTLGEGSYDIVLKDQNDCIANGTITFTLTDPTQVTAVLDSTNNISCFGADDGKIHLDLSGGTPPYTVALVNDDNNSQLQSINNVSVGSFIIMGIPPHNNYKVVVTDDNGCTVEITSLAVTTPDLLQLSVQNTGADIDCSLTNGEITAMAVGGTSPYRYSLDNVTYGASSVIAGATTSNTVYLKDANDCMAMQTINIPAATFDPNPMVTVLDPAIDQCQNAMIRVDFTPNGFAHNWKITAPGANCGSALVTKITGPSESFFEVSNLTAGSYEICAVAANCSMAPVQFQIVGLDSLKLEFTNVTDILCFGASTGSVSLQVSGGLGPYTITQNNANPVVGAMATYSGLAAGPKVYRVTDSKGCTVGLSRTLTQPSLIIYDQLSIQDALCADSTSGSISFRPIGGTGAYSVSWRPSGGMYTPIVLNGTQVELSDIGAGSYQFSITDGNNCNKEYSFTVSEPSALSLLLSDTSHISCNGAADGSITANGGGGTGNLTYSIDGGVFGANPIFSGLMPGVHTIHLKDDNNCEITRAFNIKEPAILAASAQLRDVQCNGANDGKITMASSGGTPGYKYSLDGGPFQTSNMFTQLAPGTFSVVVTDANNCSVTISSLVITEPSALTSMTTPLSEATCQNGGSAVVTYGGGTGPYSVVWDQNPAINSDTATDLAAGVHRVEITDAQGCVLLDTVDISTLGVPIIEVILIESPDCDDPSGRISVRVKGSTLAPFTYTIDGDTMPTGNFFGLAAGPHEVTISDSLGCRSARSIIVPSPSLPTLELVATVAEACGQKDGEIMLSPSGGKAPYQLEIGGTILPGTTISGLTYGQHSVKITDNRHCSDIFTFMVDSVANPTATVASLGEVCDRSNGQITVMPTSALSPFTYAWSHDTITTPKATKLSAGTYKVTVTNSRGCESVFEKTVQEIRGPNIVVQELSPASCGKQNGLIHVSINNPGSGLNIKWGHNQSNSLTQSGLAPGTYYLTITNASACQDTMSFVVDQELFPPVEVQVKDKTCAGNDGSIVIIPDGPGPFNFNWSHDASLQGGAATNLSEGTYSVSITDSSGCSISIDTTISIDSILVASVDSVANAQCGLANGSIRLTAFGENLTYYWAHDTTLNGPFAVNLPAGNYRVQVLDGSSCMIELNATVIDEGSAELTLLSVDSAICGMLSGGATIGLIGGTSPIVINWYQADDPVMVLQQGEILSQVAGGLYKAVAQDANGCTNTMMVEIPVGGTLDVDVQVKDRTCDGDNGSITVIPDGPGPFVFSWSHDVALSGGTASNLSDGPYSVSITDPNGCSISIDTSIVMDSTLAVSIDSVANTQCGQANGSIRLNASGDNLTYYWAHDTTLNGPFASNLLAGNYRVQVEDGSSCMIELNATVIDEGSAALTLLSLDSAVCGMLNGGATIGLVDSSSPIMINWYDADDPVTVIQQGEILSQVPGGLYKAVAQDENGCTNTLMVDIPIGGSLSATIDATSPSCPGAKDGSATVNVMSDQQNLTYLWTDANAQTGPMAIDLGAGRYEVKVAAGGECELILEVNIEDPLTHEVNLEILSSPSCFGVSDGMIGITVTGDNGNLQYKWNGEEISPITQVENLTAGYYQLSVLDSLGCLLVDSVVLEEPNDIQLSVGFVNGPSCISVEGGNAQLNISGGTGAYSILWSDAEMQSTLVALNLDPGPVSVLVTDENSCTDSLVIEIPGSSQELAIELNSLKQPSCQGDSDGAIELQIPDGSGAYTYTWNDSITSVEPRLQDLKEGIYVFQVSDEITGCTGRDTITLSAPADWNVSFELTNESCNNNGADGSITAVVTGGNGDYSYQWNDDQMQETATAEQLVGGIYMVTITDGKGCQVLDTAEIKATGALSLDLGGDQVILCEGEQYYVELPDSAGITYQWSGPNGFSSTEGSLYLPGEGLFWVEVEQEGCTTRDSVMVTSSMESLNALFVLPTQVVLGDTVVAVEVSWPTPDAINWIFDDQNILYIPKSNNTHYFVFSNIGAYDISLQSTIGNCIDFITKTVVVAADSASFEFPLDFGNQDILELDLTPNPNNGQFSVSVKLSSIADVFVQINNTLGSVVETRQESGSKEYKMDFNLGLQPGLHAMTIQAKSSRKTLMFLVH